MDQLQKQFVANGRTTQCGLVAAFIVVVLHLPSLVLANSQDIREYCCIRVYNGGQQDSLFITQRCRDLNLTTRDECSSLYNETWNAPLHRRTPTNQHRHPTVAIIPIMLFVILVIYLLTKLLRKLAQSLRSRVSLLRFTDSSTSHTRSGSR